MKILVTGGAGFIGSNLCEYFLQEGHMVRCLDNFATGKPENIIPLLEKYPHEFSLQVGDIRNLDDCRSNCNRFQNSLFRGGNLPNGPECGLESHETQQKICQRVHSGFFRFS